MYGMRVRKVKAMINVNINGIPPGKLIAFMKFKRSIMFIHSFPLFFYSFHASG